MHQDEENSAAFIDSADVLEEVEDDGDMPMDEDDHHDHVEGEGEGEGEESVEIVYEDEGELAGEGGEEDGGTSVAKFAGHKGSVFAVAIHPTQLIAVSGGEDDLGYIWDAKTGAEIVKLTGHTDSVTAVGWSFDGELVSTGGMDGKVRIWRHVRKEDSDLKIWEFLTELTGPEEVIWLKWHPRGLVLLAGSNDSTVWLWQLPSGNTMQVIASHTGPVNAGCFTTDGKKILTGSEILLLTTPTSESPLLKLTSADGRFALEGGITALAVNSSNSLAVVGGAEGEVRVVSLLKGDVVGSLIGHTQGESIEAVAWMTYAGTEVAVTGGTDGKICLWDLGTMRLRITMEHSDAVTSLHPHEAPSAHLLTSSSADGTLRTWDVRTGVVVREHKGHRGPILAASLHSVNNVVVSAGDDSACFVFELS